MCPMDAATPGTFCCCLRNKAVKCETVLSSISGSHEDGEDETSTGLDVEWGERRTERRPLTAGPPPPLPRPGKGGVIGCKEDD